MKKDLRAVLQSLREQNLYRERHVFEGPATPQRTFANQTVTSFCSNDYLGLANDPRIAEAFCEGVSLYGVGSGASQLVSGHSSAHRALEEKVADFTARPRALVFTSGYMANLGVMASLADRNTILFEDRLNHASLIDGGILSRAKLQRYPHKDVNYLQEHINANEHTLLASDSVFSMDGDTAPLSDLADLCSERQAWLLVDDAHGIGVFGEQGKGFCAEQKLGVEQVPILTGTFSKAAGVFGAFVAGDEDLIETLIQKARSYIYTTAPPPAIAHATLTALDILSAEQWRRDRLFERVTQFKTWLDQAGIAHTDSCSPIQSVLVGLSEDALALSQRLLEQGIHVTAIRPPTVSQGTARLRITLSCAHSAEDVEHLIASLSKLITANPPQQTK